MTAPDIPADPPDRLKRVIDAWYAWQAARERNHQSSTRPGNLLVGQRPPATFDDGSLAFVDELDVSYYLVPEDDVYYVDSEERGSRKRYWMFRRLDDAEKFLIFQFSQSARPGKLPNSPAFKWYRDGLSPTVLFTIPTPSTSQVELP